METCFDTTAEAHAYLARCGYACVADYGDSSHWVHADGRTAWARTPLPASDLSPLDLVPGEFVCSAGLCMLGA